MPVKNKKGYEKIIEVNDCTTGNLLDYENFSNNYELSAIDSSKQIELEDPYLKQKINFIGKDEGQNNGAAMFLSLKNLKKLLMNFYKNL